MARSIATAQGVSIREAAISSAMGSATAATRLVATSLLTASLPTYPTWACPRSQLVQVLPRHWDSTAAAAFSGCSMMFGFM